MGDDQTVIQAVLNGDQGAFNRLIRTHQAGLLRMALRWLGDLETAEDVVQESFLKAYLNLATFEGRSSFKSWLYRIAINTARNRLRSRGRVDEELGEGIQSVEEGADTHLIRQDLIQWVRRQVRELPDRQRLAIELRLFEDMSFTEIAEVMDCPYDTAKANFRHGLLRIRGAMEKEWSLADLKYLNPPEPIMAPVINLGGEA